MNDYSDATPPIPPHSADAARWEHTRLRRRMIEGRWMADLEENLRAHLGHTRAAALGKLDASSNVFKSISRQLAATYDRAPTLTHADPAAAQRMDATIYEAGLWPLMQRFQSRVIALREHFLRIEIDERGAVTYRPISPDLMLAYADPSNPDRPVKIMEARLKQSGWCWVVLDISDPEQPRYEVRAVNPGAPDGLGEDLSPLYLGEQPLSGDAYPYRYSDGRPFIPGTLYHAAMNGDRLWDPYEGIEVVEGSLNAAVGWSFWFHCLRSASWPQRYMAGVVPRGARAVDSSTAKRHEVIADPATVLLLEHDGSDHASQAVIGQWGPAAEVGELAEALSQFEARVAEFADVSPSDVQRLGGTARSGYAIALTNQGKRDAQQRMEPVFRRADEELLSKTAAVLNRSTGAGLPEDGYRLAYHAVPRSPQEIREEREHVLALLDRGLISPVRAYAQLHGVDERTAEIRLEAIRRQRIDLNLTR